MMVIVVLRLNDSLKTNSCRFFIYYYNSHTNQISHTLPFATVASTTTLLSTAGHLDFTTEIELPQISRRPQRLNYTRISNEQQVLHKRNSDIHNHHSSFLMDTFYHQPTMNPDIRSSTIVNVKAKKVK